jgi:hypothetical protein
MESIDIPGLAHTLVNLLGTARQFLTEPWTFYQIVIIAG